MTHYVICMKWGHRYGAHYVNVLRRGVARHLSLAHQFVCLTDDGRGLDKEITCHPLPAMGLPPARVKEGGWLKLGVFDRRLGFAGRALFLDLDVVVTGSLDAFFKIEEDELCAIGEWGKKDKINTSVFGFSFAQQHHIFDDFMALSDEAREQAMKFYRIEQHYVGAHGSNVTRWHKAWVRSFKYDCVYVPPLSFVRAPILPRGARVVAFHGKPNPMDVVQGGFWGRFARRGFGYGRVPWVEDNWR